MILPPESVLHCCLVNNEGIIAIRSHVPHTPRSGESCSVCQEFDGQKYLCSQSVCNLGSRSSCIVSTSGCKLSDLALSCTLRTSSIWWLWACVAHKQPKPLALNILFISGLVVQSNVLHIVRQDHALETTLETRAISKWSLPPTRVDQTETWSRPKMSLLLPASALECPL